jgi:alkanesulfonate monooxygenase SsuD/methylene tetrahydromethanopterin reductase-like flavin-dependent oxidoreductase (luciferase family)
VHVVYFTERPYRGLTEDEVFANGAFFGISNGRYDAQLANRDYHAYLDEFVYAEELGFDGLGLNEHHATPFCMGSVVDVEAAILARITSKAKIVLLGNALPNMHPLRLAEELATIDVISKGRLVAGWVRGAPSNQYANNVNPAYNREYFEEAHDFLVETWTRPGPFRFEGEHFQYRHVNPWVLPYQKPHPPFMICGVLSPETIRWSAQKNYPFLSLGATPALTCDMWDIYADEAARNGFQAGSENFGYFVQTALADTEDKAQEVGRSYYFGGGHLSFSHHAYAMPPGFTSATAVERIAARQRGPLTGKPPKAPLEADARRAMAYESYLKSQSNNEMLVGTPDSVIPRLKTILEVTRPGILILSAPQGNTSHEDRRRSMALIAEHVLPAIREHADKIGLVDSFQRTPGSVPLPAGTARAEVVDRGALERLQPYVAR